MYSWLHSINGLNWERETEVTQDAGQAETFYLETLRAFSASDLEDIKSDKAEVEVVSEMRCE